MRINAWLMFIAGAASACVPMQPLVVQRASRELRCPAEYVLTVPRTDIAEGVVDVRACGQVARYTCFEEKYASRCIREPLDPNDAAALLALPEPARAGPAPAAANASDPEASSPTHRRLCRDRADFDRTRNCVFVPTP